MISVKSLDNKMNNEEEKEESGRSTISKSRGQAKEHMKQLERLKEKVREFCSCSILILVLLISFSKAVDVTKGSMLMRCNNSFILVINRQLLVLYPCLGAPDYHLLWSPYFWLK